MGTDLAPPRGTQDLLPDRSDAMLGLYEAAHELARLFGFRYVETPTFEDTEVFARTSGDTSDVVTKEMYTFEDKGGRSVTLRPESTAGVVRAWLDRAQALGAPWRGVLRSPTSSAMAVPRPVACGSSASSTSRSWAWRPRAPTSR